MEAPHTFFTVSGGKNPVLAEADELKAKSLNCYRKVEKLTTNVQKGIPFKDAKFQIGANDLAGIDGNRAVSLEKLSDIIPLGTQLFSSPDRHPTLREFESGYSFTQEMGLLPPHFYNSLFVDPTVNDSGYYRIIANVGGHFQQIEVDEYVPYIRSEKTFVFGITKEYAWAVILLKAWAKILGSFQAVRTAKPFEFLRTFSYPNWKLRNLDKENAEESYAFFSKKLTGDTTPKYQAEQMKKSGIRGTALSSSTVSSNNGFTIIAKTRDNERLKEYGLPQNAVAFQLVGVFEIEGKRVIKLRSSVRHRWSGEFSVVDEKINKKYQEKLHDLALSKSFIMPFDEFRKLFSLMMISPVNYDNYFDNKHVYYPIKVPLNTHASKHFKFEVLRDGRVDISILQNSNCLVQNNVKDIGSSQLTSTGAYQGFLPNRTTDRFLKVKVLIAKVNNKATTQNPNMTKSTVQPPAVSATSGPTTVAPTQTATVVQDAEDKYEYVEVDYSHGFTSAESYFLKLTRGDYVLHIKTETVNKDITYNINIVSEMPITINQFTMSKQEKSVLLRSAFLNIAKEKGAVAYLDDKTKQEWVCYGDTFTDTGYGYVAMCAEANSAYKLYCEFDPAALKKEGFQVKDVYKNKTGAIGIYSSKGYGRCIMLKKVPGVKQVWPPQSLKFFRAQ